MLHESIIKDNPLLVDQTTLDFDDLENLLKLLGPISRGVRWADSNTSSAAYSLDEWFSIYEQVLRISIEEKYRKWKESILSTILDYMAGSRLTLQGHGIQSRVDNILLVGYLLR